MNLHRHHCILITTREIILMIFLALIALPALSSWSWISGWYFGKQDNTLECPSESSSVGVWPDHLECIIKVDRDPAAVRRHIILKRKST